MRELMLYTGLICAVSGLGLSLWDFIENRRKRHDKEDAGGAARRGEVTERLVARFGPERLWQVERMSKHIYRAWLSDRRRGPGTVMEDGSLSVRELEAVL